MAEDPTYSAARVIARGCAVAAAAIAPPLWLFSRLTPYHFQFSAPTTLSSLGVLLNVCAFTGYLFAVAALPAFIMYGYLMAADSWLFAVPTTLLIVSIAVFFFKT
jgi:hypothetical protein